MSGTYKGHSKQLSNTLSAHVSEKKILTPKNFKIFGLFFGKDPRGGNYLGGVTIRDIQVNHFFKKIVIFLIEKSALKGSELVQ